MKKEVICVLAGIAAGAAIMFFVMLLIGNAQKNNMLQSEETAGYSKETVKTADNGTEQSREQNRKQTEASTEPVQNAAAMARVDAVKSNSWESNGKFYSQYDISVANNDSMVIDGWTVMFSKNGREVTGNWNCEIEEEGRNICVKPVEFNKRIEPGAASGGAGIIVESSEDEVITEFNIVTDGFAVAASNTTQTRQDENRPKETEQESIQAASPNESTKADIKQTEVSQTVSGIQPVKPVGRLHVEGTGLVNADGVPVRLKGVSTHGLSWYPEYVNRDAFVTLKEDWNANVIRLAMYTAEYGGYCSGGDRDNLKKLIDDGVNYAASLGMYVIIDWHILSDNNPQTYKSDAIGFFSEISAKYSGYDNVIYEICNEPHNVNWNNDIKPYANEVISAIRQNDKNAVILVGTNTWSQDVDDVIGSRVDDDNVMYVLHFYAATHRDDLRSKLIKARNAGIPIFVSECSICDASGNGGIDYDSADKWLKLMNENNISFIAWSLSNKAETSALIRPECNKKSGWNESDLTDAGKWFRNAIKN